MSIPGDDGPQKEVGVPFVELLRLILCNESAVDRVHVFVEICLVLASHLAKVLAVGDGLSASVTFADRPGHPRVGRALFLLLQLLVLMLRRVLLLLLVGNIVCDAGPKLLQKFRLRLSRRSGVRPCLTV